MEAETNDSTGAANVPTLALQGAAPVHQVATVAGYVGQADGGDYYRLGNISAGTTINIGQTKPSNSPLSGILAILNSSGSAVATSAAGFHGLSRGPKYSLTGECGDFTGRPCGGRRRRKR